MGIFGLKDEMKIKIETRESNSLVPYIESDIEKHPILSYLPGYRWRVDYFHRVVDSDDVVTQYDPNLDIYLQHYTRIKDFIIYLEEAIGIGLPDNYQGSGYVVIDEPPTPNDIILSKLMDGRVGIFIVTDIDRVTYNNQPIFKINITLHTVVESLEDYNIVTLFNSVVNTYYYDPEYYINNSSPLLKEEEVVNRKTVLEYIESLIKEYDRLFIHPEFNYLPVFKDILDGIEYIIYDPNITKFLHTIVGNNRFRRGLNQLPVTSDNKYSILDYIISTNLYSYQIAEFYTYKSRYEITTNPYLFSIVYTNIDKIILITDSRETYRDNELSSPAFFPKIPYGRYMFRKKIYDVLYNRASVDRSTLTLFERVFLNFLDGITLELSDLSELYRNIFKIDDREKYYFIPILIHILKYYLTTFTIRFI